LSQSSDQPSWSPDGSKLAYKDEYQDELAVVNADGTHKRVVVRGGTSGVSSPVWSPNGHQLAWMKSGRGDQSSLWVSRADGYDRHLVRRGEFSMDPFHTLDWSPDGSQLAVVVQKHGSAVAVVRANGTALKRLSPYLDGDINAVRWSHDGKSLLVVRNNGLYLLGAKGGKLEPIKVWKTGGPIDAS
jgi:Tol biopolymer transport system component